MTPDELRKLADEVRPFVPWARGSIRAAADEIDRLNADLEDANDIIGGMTQGRDLKEAISALHSFQAKR